MTWFDKKSTWHGVDELHGAVVLDGVDVGDEPEHGGEGVAAERPRRSLGREEGGEQGEHEAALGAGAAVALLHRLVARQEGADEAQLPRPHAARAAFTRRTTGPATSVSIAYRARSTAARLACSTSPSINGLDVGLTSVTPSR